MLAALGGCAAPLPKVSEPPAAAQQLAGPEAVKGFYLSGRIGVHYDDQGFSGTLQWRHGPGGDEALILSPLGQGVARIVGNGDGVMLTTSDQKVFRARDEEELTQQVLGWALPLRGLRYWVRGLAVPGSEAERVLGPGHRLAQLRQDGWRIDYLDYSEAQGLQLPTRITMANGQVEVKLVIDRWSME